MAAAFAWGIIGEFSFPWVCERDRFLEGITAGVLVDSFRIGFAVELGFFPN